MNNKARENLLLKFLSFIVALIVWAVITNIVRPVITDFVTIPISIINEDVVQKLNKAYVVKSPLICKVSYLIDEEKRSFVRQNDFKAYIDLKDLSTNDNLPVHIEALNNIDKNLSNIRIEPSTINVVMDDVKRVEFPVLYQISGKIAEEHSIGEVVLSPNVVYVSGNDVALEKVGNISITIPVSDNEENFSGKAEVHIIGKDGNELLKTGFGLSADEINYSTSVFTRKDVIINVNIAGTPRDGYRFEKVSVFPNNIMLEGPGSIIGNVFAIDLPAISIDDASENMDFDVPLGPLLPIGTRCPTANTIHITVEITSNIIFEPTAKNTDEYNDEIIPEDSSK